MNDAMTDTRDLVKLKPLLVREESKIGVIAEVNLGSLHDAAPVLGSGNTGSTPGASKLSSPTSAV